MVMDGGRGSCQSVENGFGLLPSPPPLPPPSVTCNPIHLSSLPWISHFSFFFNSTPLPLPREMKKKTRKETKAN